MLTETRRCKNSARSDSLQTAFLPIGYEKAVKEINLCVELIDIVLECDSRCYCTKTHKVRTYVNTRNYKRFCNKWEDSDFKHQNKECFKDALRINKALHLYNLIRSYHLMSWWD